MNVQVRSGQFMAAFFGQIITVYVGRSNAVARVIWCSSCVWWRLAWRTVEHFAEDFFGPSRQRRNVRGLRLRWREGGLVKRVGQRVGISIVDGCRGERLEVEWEGESEKWWECVHAWDRLEGRWGHRWLESLTHLRQLAGGWRGWNNGRMFGRDGGKDVSPFVDS